MSPVLVNWLIGLGAFLALIWAIKGPLLFMYNLTIKAHDVFELLNGDDKNPGLDQRLKAIEEGQLLTANTLAEVRHELKPNGGSSMNDRLTRVEKILNPSAPNNH